MFTFLISDIDVSIHKHKAFKASLLSPARWGSGEELIFLHFSLKF